jgi:hypothetical protein
MKIIPPPWWLHALLALSCGSAAVVDIYQQRADWTTALFAGAAYLNLRLIVRERRDRRARRQRALAALDRVYLARRDDALRRAQSNYRNN